MKFWKYFGLRLLTWALTILIGVTFIFFIPRMFPSDPVETMIGQMEARSGSMDPVAKEALRTSLRVQFGLEGSLWEQYTTFLWDGLLHFDFGPSLMNFPTPASDIIMRNLPFTVGLSLTTTIVAWCIGNFIGLLLIGGLIIAVGLLISSLTESQIVAAIGTLAISYMLLSIDTLGMIFSNVTWLSDITTFLSVSNRDSSFSAGLIYYDNIIFFLSIQALFIFLTVRVLDSKRWN